VRISLQSTALFVLPTHSGAVCSGHCRLTGACTEEEWDAPPCAGTTTASCCWRMRPRRVHTLQQRRRRR
jgi:hypothetical protein